LWRRRCIIFSTECRLLLKEQPHGKYKGCRSDYIEWLLKTRDINILFTICVLLQQLSSYMHAASVVVCGWARSRWIQGVMAVNAFWMNFCKLLWYRSKEFFFHLRQDILFFFIKKCVTVFCIICNLLCHILLFRCR